MSNLALPINLVAVVIYGYSVFYMNFNPELQKLDSFLPEPLRIFGHLKFLTYQCLLIQLLSAVLHVGAHFVRPLQKPRDLVFTCLAYPIGSIVVYSFWAVWHLMGRELIFPLRLSDIYPDWLNHSTHTIIVPINILISILVCHKYSRRGALLTVVYFGLYTVLLHIVKFKSGFFVYKYLDEMSDSVRLIYFASTGFFAYLVYKSGQLLTTMVHGSRGPAQKQSLPKQKAKQK